MFEQITFVIYSCSYHIHASVLFAQAYSLAYLVTTANYIHKMLIVSISFSCTSMFVSVLRVQVSIQSYIVMTANYDRKMLIVLISCCFNSLLALK